MPNFLLTYTGGSNMPTSEEEVAAVMAEWGAWYGALGDNLVDGGAPLGESTCITGDGVAGAGSEGHSSGLTGFTIITASDLDAAVNSAKGCPVLGGGGQVEVHTTIDM